MDRIAAEKKLAPMISGEYFNVRKSFEFVWIANKSGDPCGGCFKAIRATPLRVVFFVLCKSLAHVSMARALHKTKIPAA
jgi:hypothetical protein